MLPHLLADFNPNRSLTYASRLSHSLAPAHFPTFPLSHSPFAPFRVFRGHIPHSEFSSNEVHRPPRPVHPHPLAVFDAAQRIFHRHHRRNAHLARRHRAVR